MPSDHALSISTPMLARARAAGVWLARSRVTASNAMKAIMGKSHLTIHSASGGRMLFSLDWSGPLIVVNGNELESPYRFHEMKSAIAFFDAVLLSYAAGPSLVRSTDFDPLEFGTPRRESASGRHASLSTP